MSDSDNAVYTAVFMLLAIVLIVGIVFGYKQCQATDERIDRCLSNGHHTAEECRNAYAAGRS